MRGLRWKNCLLLVGTAILPVAVSAAPGTPPTPDPSSPPPPTATPALPAAFPASWPPQFVEKTWKQVHPAWRRAFLLSYRSPDLLSYDPDERWGRYDGRLQSGGILSEFPAFLEMHKSGLQAAREQGRPILLSLHFHSGYGAGIVSYSPDLTHGEAANYPWLIRTLIAAGLDTPDVTVAVDTCNSQATSAHQLRTDLIPRGVEAFPPFAAWRRGAGRAALPRSVAYQRFSQARVSEHLGGGARGRTANVRSVPFDPLTPAERSGFRANLYGQRGVILATPTLFNLLRLGPNPRGCGTANLLRDRVDTVWVGGYLEENNAEFRKFREYGYLANAGPGYILVTYKDGLDPAAVAAKQGPRTAEGAASPPKPPVRVAPALRRHGSRTETRPPTP